MNGAYWQKMLKPFVGLTVSVFGDDRERPLAMGKLTDLGVNHVRVIDEQGGKTEVHYDLVRMVVEPWQQ